MISGDIETNLYLSPHKTTKKPGILIISILFYCARFKIYNLGNLSLKTVFHGIS